MNRRRRVRRRLADSEPLQRRHQPLAGERLPGRLALPHVDEAQTLLVEPGDVEDAAGGRLVLPVDGFQQRVVLRRAEPLTLALHHNCHLLLPSRDFALVEIFAAAAAPVQPSTDSADTSPELAPVTRATCPVKS